jgi:hypothetical protein
LGVGWNDWLICDILRQEAKKLFAGQERGSKSDADGP